MRKQKKLFYFISYTCSGATLLENIFLELKLRLKFEQDLEGIDCFKLVKKVDKTLSLYEKTEIMIPSQFGLPTLAKNEKFLFRNDAEIFFTHNRRYFSNEKTLILIRDPRDTLLSQFRIRHQENTDSFHEFTMTHLKTWLEFYNQAISKPHFYFVKFEDLKNNPNLTMRGLLNYFSLNYSIQEVADAIAESTFEKTKEIENQMIQSHPDIAKEYFPNRITKNGKCAQYKLPENNKHQTTFDYIQKETSNLLRYFNYEH